VKNGSSRGRIFRPPVIRGAGSFANHEVVLEGARLALLLPEIASFHLDSLRDMPTKFRSQADKNEPFITRVSVRSALNSQESSPKTC
jgi:hypothetical protein